MNWLNECSNDSAFPEELAENSGALKIHQSDLIQIHSVQIHSHGKVNENMASREKSSSPDAPSFTYLQPRVPPHLPHGPIGFSKLEVDYACQYLFHYFTSFLNGDKTIRCNDSTWPDLDLQ